MKSIESLYNIALHYISYLYNIVINNKEEAIIILLVIFYLYLRSRKSKKKLKKKRYKKAKLASNKKYYNTGIRFEINFYDAFKFKLRLADYCDKKGVRFSYLFDLKLFSLEFLRVKVIDQKGHVTKRKITFRG